MDCPLFISILSVLWSIAYHTVLILGIFFCLATIVIAIQAIVEMRRSGESFTRYTHRMDVRSIKRKISHEEAGLRPELKEWYLKEIESIDLGVGCRCCGKGGVEMGREDGTHGFVFVERDVEKWAEALCEKK
ncbi:hypothetical protein DL98DRAFT_518290 [Cadophora sp. DSE1049]|nr:hypothetical protein DL98DRAFT_518290 [Cadophora sp. DSE1049]